MATRTAYRLKEKFTHVMKNGHKYPLFTDDELALDSVDQQKLIGTFTKVCPGLCIAGIEIPMELVEKYEEDRVIVLW